MKNIQLGYLKNGNVAIMTDTPFPDQVKRIEYYKDQKLLMIVYKGESHEGDLMHYELEADAQKKVEASNAALIVMNDNGAGAPEAYYVSLVKVGI